MKAFHGYASVKEKYIARVEAHMAADEVTRGVGFEPASGGKKAKMCAVGSTLDAYDHSRYPFELGIPEWLARVEDTLFEGMSVEKSKTWPRDFLNVIDLGVNLERAKAPFLLVVLRSTLRTFDHTGNPKVAAAVQGAIALWERSDIGTLDWISAASAAESAARSAASAAYDSFADALILILRGLEPVAETTP